MLTLVVNTKVNPNVNQKMKHWFWVTDTANPYTTDQSFVAYLNKLPIKMCRPLAKDESHILQVSQQKKLHPNSLHLEDFRLDCKSPKRTKMKN